MTEEAKELRRKEKLAAKLKESGSGEGENNNPPPPPKNLTPKKKWVPIVFTTSDQTTNKVHIIIRPLKKAFSQEKGMEIIEHSKSILIEKNGTKCENEADESALLKLIADRTIPTNVLKWEDRPAPADVKEAEKALKKANNKIDSLKDALRQAGIDVPE